MWAEWGKTTLQPSFVGPVWFPLLLGRAGPGDPAWDKARAGFETRLDILEAQLGRQPLGNGGRLHPRRHRDRPPALPLLHHRHGPPRPPDAGRLLPAPDRAPGLREPRHGPLRRAQGLPALMQADYVIVGSGSAGSAVAYRLSEAGHSVAVIEHGGSDWGPFIQMPAALSYPMNMARYDWGFRTEPEPHLGGRSLATPRGKVLGGSSSINGMVYVRGHPKDFDHWAEAGADGWSFADVLPYFQRMEHWHGGALRLARPRRPAARHPRPAPQPALPLLRRGRRPGRLRAHLRLQRPEAGGLRPDGADGLARPPLVRRQRLPAPGDRPRQRRHRLRPRRPRRHRAKAAPPASRSSAPRAARPSGPAARSSSRPPRSTPRSC